MNRMVHFSFFSFTLFEFPIIVCSQSTFSGKMETQSFERLIKPMDRSFVSGGLHKPITVWFVHHTGKHFPMTIAANVPGRLSSLLSENKTSEGAIEEFHVFLMGVEQTQKQLAKYDGFGTVYISPTRYIYAIRLHPGVHKNKCNQAFMAPNVPMKSDEHVVENDFGNIVFVAVNGGINDRKDGIQLYDSVTIGEAEYVMGVLLKSMIRKKT